MKIQFLGAAQTVTGSCYLIEACGTRFTVDCGMFQGNSNIESRNLDTEQYRPTELDFVLLTHAHIDHSGLLPRIVAEGFKGPIYCTPPTAALAGIMLEDSAHIQEMEAEWKRKKQTRQNGQNGQLPNIAPLYTIADAQKAAELFHTVEYEKTLTPHEGISVTYRDAGHILGSAFLELHITEEGKTTRLVFSGDIGRPGTLLMHDPATAAQADYLFVESTYGDRNHKNEDATLDELGDAIAYGYNNHDKVIIPAFAVGRTQEMLYCLYLLKQKGKLPADMPVFVDSPLAIRATDIFKQFNTYLDTPEIVISANIQKELPNVHFTLNATESQALNTMKGPAIIISASGMCNAGRIKHHLRHNAWRPTACIVFVGYQGAGTPGRKIVDGAKSIRLFNEDIAIKAKIFTIGGFSAHAGQSQIMDWIGKMEQPKMQVVLIHGEERAQQTLAKLIQDKYKLPVSIPGYLEEMTLQPGAMPQVLVTAEPKSQPRVDWEFLLGEMDHKLQHLHTRLKNAQDRPWEEQMDIRDRILELNKEFLSVLAQI